MKTAIVFKWCRDPQDARVTIDGSVKWGSAKMTASDDDPAAMDVARSLSDESDIIGVTLGDGKPEWAAARGASRTLVVSNFAPQADGNLAADAIKAAVEHAGGVDVVVIGDTDWDRSVAPALAGKLGWPAFFGVTSAETDGDAVRLTCKGADESRVVETSTPILIAAKALEDERNVPGMKQTLAARKKPVEKVTLEGLGVDRESSAASSGTRKPEGEPCTIIDGADPEQAAAKLVNALRGDGLL